MLFALLYLLLITEMPPRMPFLANKYMSGSVNNSNVIPDFFNVASHAKPGAEK